ncbi:replication initiation factor domain-containing protein [Pseudoduganella sp. R-34]|uniref:replication initiation factor domain-containing protein n=1 Tax=Pseudoduganella sp. R-34 TaxID=3404062 RepID=UPI003CECF390
MSKGKKLSLSARRQLAQGDAEAYAAKSGGSPARKVKSEIYGRAKVAAEAAGWGAQAARPAATAPEGGLMPQKQGVAAGAEQVPPINNMGENLRSAGEAEVSGHWVSLCDEHLGEVKLVLSDSGETKTVMVRRPSESQAAIIDWINFTVLEDTFFRTARQILISDDQIIEEASRQLEAVFGFGITNKRERGMNFYRESWELGDKMGFVCFGGQRQTMLITLTGQGCTHATPGWEHRLYRWLTEVAVRPSISRIDLAHDDLQGDYLSVDWADDQWAANGFSFQAGGRPPEIQHLGNWRRPSGKGRTLTIGTRASSKFCRFYEKGRKEGDKQSKWCRVEVEFKNTSMVIVPDVLLNPSKYFVGAYPCFKKFEDKIAPERLKLKQKVAQINWDATKEIVKRQFGRHLRVGRELEGDKDFLDEVCCEGDDYWPKRLLPVTAHEVYCQ